MTNGSDLDEIRGILVKLARSQATHQQQAQAEMAEMRQYQQQAQIELEQQRSHFVPKG